MGIPDLLWTCPLCRGRDRLQAAGKGARCPGCGATFRRVRGARIAAVRTGEEQRVRSAAEWLDALPDPTLEPGPDGAIRRAHGELRRAVADLPLRRDGYLGRAEQLGERRAGEIVLEPARIAFSPEDGSEPLAWPFEALTAVQPSSRSLQLKARDRPLASLKFRDDSVRLWEELVRAALRRWYRERGLGEIVEFQPRIVAR